MTDIHVRQAREADFPDVLRMIEALADHHDDQASVTLAELARDLSGPAPWITCLVAERDGVLVGYAVLAPLVQLQFGVWGMDMHHLFVSPALRQQGVARALVRACLRHARQMHCSYMTVGTHPDNLAAQTFYPRIGFEKLPAPGPRFRMKLA